MPTKKDKEQDESIDAGRRAFFKRGLNKTAETVTKGADALARHRAQHWIRPPYAIDELEFLLTCTRCDGCIEACPHQVIFALSTRLGIQVAGTPAMDVLNKGCHLCADWPCVAACEPLALKLPATDAGQKPPLPRMAEARIDSAQCLPYSGPECGACNASCPVPGALTWNMTKPVIDAGHCTGCGLCREACIVEPKAVSIHALPA